MNYDQLIDKCNKLEETLDIVLLTMTRGVGASPELYLALESKVKRAQYRQHRRQIEEEARLEYWNLKQRQSELEFNYPDLVKKT